MVTLAKRAREGRANNVKTTRTQKRAKMRDLARVAEGGYSAPNFHTHIGRPVLDSAGNPTYERVPSIHGNGRLRIKYEYVPRFSDPEETARVMVRAAARKAVLDAKRAAKAPRIAATEARRAGIRAAAQLRRLRERVASA